MEDEPAPAKPKPKPAAAAPTPSSNPAEWLRQMERNFEANSNSPRGGGGGGASSSGRHGSSSHHHGGSGGANLSSTMVSVVGYDAVPSSSGNGNGNGGGYNRGGGAGAADPYRVDNSPYASLNRQYSGGYQSITGTAAVGAGAGSGQGRARQSVEAARQELTIHDDTGPQPGPGSLGSMLANASVGR